MTSGDMIASFHCRQLSTRRSGEFYVRDIDGPIERGYDRDAKFLAQD
jgi:hypothetical protein